MLGADLAVVESSSKIVQILLAIERKISEFKLDGSLATTGVPPSDVSRICMCNGISPKKGTSSFSASALAPHGQIYPLDGHISDKESSSCFQLYQ